MKCCRGCPCFAYSDSGEECCTLFGEWNNVLQYEDKNGDTIGCYVQKWFIVNYAKRSREEAERIEREREESKNLPMLGVFEENEDNMATVARRNGYDTRTEKDD